MRFPELASIALALTVLCGSSPAQSTDLDSQGVLTGALARLRAERVLPCDTWVALPDATASGWTLLAKNSDRTVFDCQPLLSHPRQSWPEGSSIDLGRVSVPQVKETFATLGSSPYWCWGYEEGINEFGVAIGNEGLFTRARNEQVAASKRGKAPALGPTGMDLLRMTLERSRTAREAVEVLGNLLEEHGQFGSGLPGMPVEQGAYDNSFLVADAGEAWVVETCERSWAARRFTSGTTSISNVPSITTQWDLSSADLVAHAIDRGWWPSERADDFDFSAASLDASPTTAAQAERARTRATCSADLLAEKEGDVTPRWMMRIARDRSTNPSLDLDVTASSCVAVLPPEGAGRAVFWWCPTTPSNSCYVPFFVAAGDLPATLGTAGTVGRVITAPSVAAEDAFAPESYWWQFRELCDLVNEDYLKRNTLVRAAFDPLEQAFEAGLVELLEEAGTLEDEAASQLLAAYSASCVEQVLEALGPLKLELGQAEVVIPEHLEPFVGKYRSVLTGNHMEILARSDALAVKLPDGRVFDLLDGNTEGRWVFALTTEAAVSFDFAEDGSVTGMHFHQAGATYDLERVDPVD